jgi:ribosomal protein L29
MSFQSSAKVKAGALWTKNKDDLSKQLSELKSELGQLRIQKIANQSSKLNKMYVREYALVPGSPPGHRSTIGLLTFLSTI